MANYKLIETTEGVLIKVDNDVYEEIKDFKWRLTISSPQTNVKTDGKWTSAKIQEFMPWLNNNDKVYFLNNDITDWRKENIGNITEQYTKRKELFLNTNKVNKKHNVNYHGITRDSRGYYIMQFTINKYRVDRQLSKDVEKLALLHDKYSILYNKEPLKLNFDEKFVKAAIKKDISDIKIIKYKPGDNIHVMVKEGKYTNRVKGSIIAVCKDDRYDVEIKTKTGENKILNNIHIFDMG